MHQDCVMQFLWTDAVLTLSWSILGILKSKRYGLPPENEDQIAFFLILDDYRARRLDDYIHFLSYIYIYIIYSFVYIYWFKDLFVDIFCIHICIDIRTYTSATSTEMRTEMTCNFPPSQREDHPFFWEVSFCLFSLCVFLTDFTKLNYYETIMWGICLLLFPTTEQATLCTPWKINMEPTNHPFRKENDLPNLHYCVPC